MSDPRASHAPRHRAQGHRQTGRAQAPMASGHRPELHGLRGLAIALVVLYHVFFDRVSGGVDVFLFISAFFLTGSFVRRMEDGRPMAPLAYWARTFKRLLPPAALVILVTLAGVRLLLPASSWMPVVNDAIASLLHVENWLLIHRGADYEAAAMTGTSPLQHFWSLSIQGQVFLLWPLLFALCAVLTRRFDLAPRRVVLVLFSAIAAASFLWSVIATAGQQQIAYFDTSTRVWEFAAGSLLALWPAANAQAPASERSRRLRTALGWAGLAALISTGALIDGRSMFPGWIAALPLLGATGVFLAGTTGSRLGADRLLSSRPFAFLGDVSYGLYLIHWPLLTLLLLSSGRESTGLLRGTLVIAVSLVLAWLLTRLVDSPIRHWRWANARPLRAGAVVAMVLVIGLGPSFGAQTLLQRAATEAERRAFADGPGARVLDPAYEPHRDANPDAPPLPAAATLRQDWSQLELACEGALALPETDARAQCRMTEAPEDAPVIVAVGNSRLGQSAMSLAEPARENGWRLVILWAPSCVFTPGIESYEGPECDAHNAAVMDHLLDVQPEAVALATSQLPGEGPERIGKVTERTMPELMDEGIDIIALRDTARVLEDPVACLEAGGGDSCTQEISREVMPEVRTDSEVLAMHAGRGGAEIFPVDLLPVTCPEHSCPPIIGNVHVMFDVDHLTATYAQSTGTEVERQLAEARFTW